MGAQPKSTETVSIIIEPQEYFRELVSDAVAQSKLSVREETVGYLVGLLSQFISSERLNSEPLYQLAKDAFEEPTPQMQIGLFKNLGDVSLYVAGYFQDSLQRKLVDVDYYVQMGERAYSTVASRTESPPLRSLYGELAGKFNAFVDVLAIVGDKTQVKTEKDLLRMYELWLKTRSERAARALQGAGIIPNASLNDTLKKDWQ